MNELKIFKNSEFGEIRTVEIEGKPFFCGSDVAKALGYSEPHKAVARHCRDDGMKRTPIADSLGRVQETVFIPEGDLYRLIVSSKLPTAEKFERWVFDEVLPSIRKHGLYATDELLDNPDLIIQMATKLKEEREARKALEAENERMQPLALFAKSVSASDTSILIGDLAKLLKQNGYDTGQKRLFEELRQRGFLMKAGSSKNLPTQKAMELGLFEVKESTMNNPDGSVRVTKTTKVTGKGQVYFVNLFLGKQIEKVG